MIAHIQIQEKSFGSEVLYKNLDIKIQAGEKIGLVGRNGTGKSTLLNIVNGQDTHFSGDVVFKKNLVVVSSRQEHHEHEETRVLDYIVNDLPEYTKLKHIMDTYPDTMGDNQTKIQTYSDTLERFAQLGFFNVEEEIIQLMEVYQIPKDKIGGKISELSGGQKRLIELVKIQRSNADLVLVDEPTNHMDYVAKKSFIDWLKQSKDAVVAITHDRDLLGEVDRIIEIRDGEAKIFEGNYDAYLRGNALGISTGLNDYQVTQSRIKNLQDSVVRFQRLKEKARNPGTIAQFKRLEQEARTELTELEAKEKPSFWIDKESIKGLKPKHSASYEKHKTQNIRISTQGEDNQYINKILSTSDLSLGYDNPLFQNLNFGLMASERLEIRGRNGVGKTTIVKAIIDSQKENKLDCKVFAGEIEINPLTKIGVYEQELPQSYMSLTLVDAVYKTYIDKGLDITTTKIKSLLSDYLFNPHADADKPISNLSGGQKARLQLISMLAGKPNLLILDEPTNHLDLPSIEELETTIANYKGAVIFISHDSYFAQAVGGKLLELKAKS